MCGRIGGWLVAGWLMTPVVLFAAGAEGSERKSLCAMSHPSDRRIEWRCEKRVPGKTPRQLWGERWIDVLRFNRLDRVHFAEINSLKVPVRLESVADFTPMPLFHSPAEKDEKYILIDLSEQFLGAYAYGRLVLSAPITTGTRGSATPRGTFRVSAFDRDHRSTEYRIEPGGEPYPMRHALMFHQDEEQVQYWIHGRDMPGYPGSHGCIGLYDEQMTHNYMDEPATPVLRDAERLFNWVVAEEKKTGGYRHIADGPRVEVRGTAPGKNLTPP